MRRDEERLGDILDHIDSLSLVIVGRSRADFDSNPMFQKAVLHDILIIGEAASHVSAEIQDKYPDVPWREISDTRNVIVHAYFSLNLNIIWQAATEDLLPLRTKVAEILKAEFPDSPESE
jgi:uncharacterized protein with HEPN domain